LRIPSAGMAHRTLSIRIKAVSLRVMALRSCSRRRVSESSMDGRGAWRDNIFVERLWRSVKYEEVYLHAYESVSMARAGLTRYFQFNNSRRPHSSLGGQTRIRSILTTRCIAKQLNLTRSDPLIYGHCVVQKNEATSNFELIWGSYIQISLGYI